MVVRIPLDSSAKKADRAILQMQATDLIRRECQQYIASTRLVIEATRLSIEAHRIRLEAGELQREIRSQRILFRPSLDLEVLEQQKHMLCQTADQLQAQVVQLLSEAMRLRSHLMMPFQRK